MFNSYAKHLILVPTLDTIDLCFRDYARIGELPGQERFIVQGARFIVRVDF